MKRNSANSNGEILDKIKSFCFDYRRTYLNILYLILLPKYEEYGKNI